MHTTTTPPPAQHSKPNPATPLVGSVQEAAEARSPQLGRPSGFSSGIVEALCAIVRATGSSDSGAAARANVHPSTVSRWKRDYPEFALLLRSAREEFRAAQLDVILSTINSGAAHSWRAAAWLLERTFPEDYSPRAKERALFREQYDAACAAEVVGDAPMEHAAPSVELRSEAPEVDSAVSATSEAPLQNGQNSPASTPTSDSVSPPRVHNSEPAPATAELRLPVSPLQNVQKAVLTGSILPRVA